MRGLWLNTGVVVLTAMALAVSTLAHGQSPPAAQELATQAKAPSHSGHRNILLAFRSDESVEKTTALRIKAEGEAALKVLRSHEILLHDGVVTFEILDAYTEKADGRRIEIDAASVATRLSQISTKVQMRVKTVVFPDLAVGDAIVLRTRQVIKPDPATPGFTDGFVADGATSQSIRIEAPKTLKINIVVGVGFDHIVTESETMTSHSLYHGPTARTTRKPEPGAVTTMFARFPVVMVSTMKRHEDFGRTIWSAFEENYRITPEIARVAEEITRGITDRRAQVQAIDFWVKRNIRYLSAPIDVNAGWPNNAATVLRNRSGDCKEHAILMVALLAAKGISSELVLVNASASYTLEPPGIPAFDHMMLYLPEFGIYTDPTASLAPFGVLAAETYDKPVMHFSAEGARIARTPAMRADEHVTINRTTITVAADGTIRGRTIEQSTGIFATYARSFATTIPIKGSEKAAADQLKLNGTPGTGRYEVPALNAPGSPWIVTGEFKLDAPYKATPGPQVIPVGLATRGRPGSFLFGARHPDRTSPFVCFAGRQVEEIDIEFADGLPLPVVAKDRTIKTGVFTYTSDAKLEGRTLRIRREFVSRVAGQVCAAELEAELAPALKTVSTNVQSRLQVAAPN